MLQGDTVAKLDVNAPWLTREIEDVRIIFWRNVTFAMRAPTDAILL